MHDEIAKITCPVYDSLAFDLHERRARWVMGITVAVMVLELLAGYWTQSLALMADGWHMATHVGTLGLTAFAYWFARTRAAAKRFAMGIGKVEEKGSDL